MLLEPSGSRLEAPLEPSWVLQDISGDLSGRSWSRLEAPWSRLEASGAPGPTSENAFLMLSFESQPCF